MKIIESIINNYRSCIKTKVLTDQNLTVLIGANGVGKSNILYSLQLFSKADRNQRFYRKENYTNLETKLDLKIKLEKQEFFVKAIFYYETNERNIDEVQYASIKYRPVNTVNKKKWYDIDSDLIEYANYSRRVKMKHSFKEFENEIAQTSIRLVQSLSDMSYYSATQFSDPSKCPVSIELEDFRLTSRGRNSANKNHTRFIYDLYRASNSENSIFDLFLNTVGPNGLNLIENIEFFVHTIPSSTYKVRTGGELEKITKSKRIIVPSINIDGLQLSPNQLSEGTFKTLALVFYILNDSSDILLIEEPEVSVHHGLLSSIMELVKQQSKNKQIIISTHSDAVLDMIEPENILMIKKEKGKGTIAKTLTQALSKNEYKALKEYLKETGNLGEYWTETGFDYE